MATKTRQNFEMWSGDHRNLIFTTTDSSGASVNLAGASATWVLSEQGGGASILKLNTDSGSGVTISGCTFTVSLSPAHTAGLDGIYYHESQIRDTVEDISTVAVGTAKINADIFTG